MNKYSMNDDVSYSLGMSLTIEAIKHASDYVENIILSTKANKNEQLSCLLNLCNDLNIDVIYDDNLITKLSLKENCYCIGVFKKFYRDLVSNNHIVLYGFNDYGELGTILRSAVSFNFKDIVLINSNIDYFDPRCVRASMGSLFHCSIVRFDSFKEYKEKYMNQNIIPFISKANNELKDLTLPNNYSIIISQDYYGLDEIFNDGYYISHSNLDDISLSIRASVIFNHIYYLNLNR